MQFIKNYVFRISNYKTIENTCSIIMRYNLGYNRSIHTYQTFLNSKKAYRMVNSCTRPFSNKNNNIIMEHSIDMNLDTNEFEKTCEETLESLTEYFEEVIDGSSILALADISYSGGVLTVNLGEQFGTYVINRQSPNKQIWLSSPISGPKRYDFIISKNCWIYKHDGIALHDLLQAELKTMLNLNLNFSKCSYSPNQENN